VPRLATPGVVELQTTIRMKEKINLKNLSTDDAESEIEWILEAKAEGYTWKQLAAKYGVSIKTIKKFVGK
jgi:DNA-binding NarL/FixJ family response regulator